MDEMDENDARVFMVRAVDQLGDFHVFVTSDQERALTAYTEMSKRYERVHGNTAVEWLLDGRDLADL